MEPAGARAMAGLAGTWQRLHPLSPLVRAGRGVFAIVVILLLPASHNSGSSTNDWLHVIVLVVAFLLAGISWLVTRWRIEDGDLRMESGLIRRTSERFPLSQIQAIDTVRPGLARVLGLAELRIRVAGGSRRAGRLAYLTSADAEVLRVRLLAMSRGAAVAAAPDVSAPAFERTLITVESGPLLASLMLSGPGLLLELLALALFLAAILAPTVAAGAATTAALALVVLVIHLFQRLNGSYGLTVSETGMGLRVRAGLIETSDETIPGARIQAIRMVEPFLWRMLGWCRVEVDVASQKSRGRQDRLEARAVRSLLPVGPRGQGLALVATIFPEAPHERLVPPARARLKSPLRYGRLSWAANDRFAVTTSGRLRRATDWVPLAKVQSIRRVEGPVQRALALASVHLDTAGRRVHAVVRDRDREEAARLLEELPDRCRHARRLEVAGRG